MYVTTVFAKVFCAKTDVSACPMSLAEYPFLVIADIEALVYNSLIVSIKLHGGELVVGLKKHNVLSNLLFDYSRPFRD